MLGVKLSDRYQIESEIARGGMASVWLATDEVLQRQVAAKILHEHLGADETFRERFRVEALAAARLTHPNVVAVFDTGDHEGIPFIVMEYLAGGTLADLIARKKSLSPDETARIGADVCSALGYAHEMQIIHRDIKPGNILFSESGHTKVADFGIAKAAFAQGDLTQSGAILGTVRYLSPEQVKSEQPDGRADLYSLGVVLYEAATGRPPFSGENDLAIATARLGPPPPRPRDLRPDVPRELDAVIMRSLATDLEERFQDASAMRQALEDLVSSDQPESQHLTQEVVVDSFVKSEAKWLFPALILLIVAGVLVTLFALPSARDTLKELLPGGESDQPLAPVKIVSAATYDPQGDDRLENERDAPLAVDSDPNTSWRTDRYNRKNLGGLKDGVGIFVDLGSSQKVSSIRVLSAAEGWQGSIRFSDDGESWSPPSGGVEASRDQTFDVDGSHRYWMVWITELAPSGSGKWAVEIAEIEAR